jgi:hypothetical protein
MVFMATSSSIFLPFLEAQSKRIWTAAVKQHYTYPEERPIPFEEGPSPLNMLIPAAIPLLEATLILCFMNL